ncbi:glycosyl transferase family 1 [Flavobacteriales bacterium 33_180_T64]|nr:glycosyl transferase family 1 [Flavobacteriales bacterium 33_180_T64]
MKKILYIGNNLKSKKSNLSGIQTLGPLLEKEGYKMFYASSKSNKVLRLFDMVKSCLTLSKQIDLVLIDTYSTQNFYYALIVSQLCSALKLPYIPILHGGNLPKRLKRNPKMSQLLFENAKCSVAPSLYLKNAFETFNYKNVVHISNALEVINYPFLNKVYDSPKLLWVRSFSKIYNPKLAVKAFNAIKQTYPNAELCMIGPDSDGTLKDVKALVKELKLNVKFTGKLGKKEWIELSKTYNVFINTTNFDNMPVSVIEAMALGLPVVSTNVGGIPFLIHHNTTGLLVNPDSVNEMTKAILDLMTNKQNRTILIQNARIQAEQYDWVNIKKQWSNILEKDFC